MKRLVRNKYDKKICGVCSGIADYFEIDPTLVRIGVIIAGVLTAFFPIAIAYVVCAAVIPEG